MTVCAAGAAALLATVAAAACGTDNFAAVPPVDVRSGSSPTPQPQATVLRVIPVTPAPTRTPTPFPAPDPVYQLPQRPFPESMDTEGNSVLPEEVVVAIWTGYLEGARVRVDPLHIDIHLCTDGTIIPASEANVVQRGQWTVRKEPGGRWFEVLLARAGSNNRRSGIVLLSRSEGSTIAVTQNSVPVFVTDSDVCG